MASVDQHHDKLQSKYGRLAASSSSKIPVKDNRRQVSTPIQPLDDSQLGSNVKRSSIPRITSSPVVPSPVSSSSSSSPMTRSNKRSNLTPLANVTNTRTPPKQNNPTPKGKITSDSKRSTPPSTLTKLTSQLESLSLDSPIPTRASSSAVPQKRVTCSDTAEQNPVQLAMDKKKTRINNKSIMNAESCQTQPLESRTSMLLRSRVKSISSVASSTPSPVKKSTVTRKASLQAVPSPIKRVNAPANVKPKQPTTTTITTSDDSPLVSRLRRSTTAFNLKTSTTRRSQRTISEVSTPSLSTSSSNIPQHKNIPKRIVSEKPDLLRSTRSSRLKQEASVMNLNAKIRGRTIPESSTNPSTADTKTTNTSLNIPKKRSMTKSFSVNVGIKDLTQASKEIPQPNKPTQQRRVVSARARPLSTIYNQRVSSRSSTPQQTQKCSTTKQLHTILSEFTGTRETVESWDKDLNVIISRPSKSPSQILRSNKLNTFEKAEIIKSDEVFYLGNVGHTHVDPSNFGLNFGFDDKDNNLIVNKDDHINYRYQVLGRLGTGMFGKVYKCQDHKSKCVISLKIMRNDPEWSLQSINEIKILKQLNHENLLSYIDYFNFRSHICITTELLSVTLLEALEATKFKGFDIQVIQLWSKQLLSGLEYIHSHDIIHGDLKPENIMLKSPHSFDLKIIDFGSSATAGTITFPYIQSRFYRAPEVLLGCRYDTKIDIWSFASLIYEMYVGSPLFEAKDEESLYKLIVRLIGHPTARTIINLRNDVFQRGSINKYNDPHYIDKKTMIFTKFDRLGNYKGLSLDQPRMDTPMQRKLKLDHSGFAAFLQDMLVWNPRDRPGGGLLLQHDFLKGV